jgi:hypothetical protein
MEQEYQQAKSIGQTFLQTFFTPGTVKTITNI